LIIFLNTDESIKRYKGPVHPIIPWEERAWMLAGLESTNHIIPLNDLTPNAVLEEIKPDVHCNGSDYGENCIEKETVEKNGGKIHILEWKEGFSTTNLIKKIKELPDKPEAKAVFLDRDGTINDNGQGYVYKIEDLKFLPEAIPALQRLSKTDYKIIILTNQSGIGRGYFSEEEMQNFHIQMLDDLKSKGIRIDKIYFCPHHPDDQCSCRKPSIGLLEKAVRDFGINLSKSWVVGNEDKDILMGKRANTRTILVDQNNNLLKAVENILKS